MDRDLILTITRMLICSAAVGAIAVLLLLFVDDGSIRMAHIICWWCAWTTLAWSINLAWELR